MTAGPARRVVDALASRRAGPRIAELATTTSGLRSASRRQRALSRRQAADIRMLRLDLERMSSQLAALEVRFADAMPPGRPPGTYDEPSGGPAQEGAGDDVRTLLAEVRREHQQIRVRFGVVTSYEERVRRLEEATFGEDSTLR